MKIELDYVKVGDYYLPDPTAELHPDRGLGKYGLMRLRYLKEHRPIVWAKLVMDGKLYAHLLETEDAANDLLDSMMPGYGKGDRSHRGTESPRSYALGGIDELLQGPG